MMHFRQYLLLILLPAAGNALAQAVKNEMETSIQPHQMPEKAMLLLQPVLKDALRVRHYQETDGEQITYESKLQWKGDFYSIEFKQDGSLLDIEKLVKFRTLPGRSASRWKPKWKLNLTGTASGERRFSSRRVNLISRMPKSSASLSTMILVN